MNLFVKRMMAAVMLLFAIGAFAQQMPPMPELTDSLVRTGKLPNGLTYYIRHNEYPKGQADFHIAQRVGAVQEDENQNGLAHFLEHMCFNGTKNFPDKQLLTWLESIGVKFGMNLNAHTSTDETVYDITNVPVARETVVDSCLLILHDWADALTLSDEEINKERGVIHEEWRMGNGAVSRILDRHAPELYPNTKYATHNVIGKMEIIDNFEPQVLRDYYEKWYRPDLQGIIVVGDIDVDKVEAKIKKIFSPIKMPENPAKFEYSLVGDNDEPVVISDKDKEMPFNIIFIAQKYDLLPRELRNTDAALMIDYMDDMVDAMFQQRMTDLTLSPDAPFAGSSVGMSTFLYASTKGALMMQVMVNDKGSEAALRAALTELKKVREYGFTATEYDRARAQYLSELETKYNNRTTDKNNVYAQRYISHFINNTPIVGIDQTYAKMKAVAPMIPVEQINAYIKEIITDKNLVVMSMCPEKEGVVVPTKEQLQKVIAEVEAAKVEAYVDNTVNEPLMAELPKKGSIVKADVNTALGYTELTLSNGVKVLLKPTDFKEDEILLSAESAGGASLYPAEDYPNAVMSADMIGTTGLSKFSFTDLQKLLSGKNVELNVSVGDYKETVSGKSTPKDLETMMQLLYLNFTSPREDAEAFATVKNMVLSQLQNLVHDPQYVFSDTLTHVLYAHHPKAMVQSPEMVSRLDYDRALQIYKERFANAADFTFVITGNFDMNEMQGLVEQYIASLPSNKNFEKAADDGKDFAKGNVRKQFTMKNEQQLAMLAMLWTGDLDYTLENKVKVQIAGQLMANQLLNSVREDEGAAYSPYSVGDLRQTYKDGFVIQTAFGVNPQKSESSEKLTINSLETLAKDIPDAELAKMKEYMLKKADENAHENRYWSGVLMDYATEGVDLYTDYKNVINSLTAEDMEQFVASLLGQGNRCEVLMLP